MFTPRRALPVLLALALTLAAVPALADAGGPSTAQIQQGTISTKGLKASGQLTFPRTDDLDFNRAARAFGDVQRARLVDLTKPSKKYVLTRRFLDSGDTDDKLVPGYSGDPADDFAVMKKAHHGYRGVEKILNFSNGYEQGAPGIGLLESFIVCVDASHLSLYDTRTGKTLKTYVKHQYIVSMKQALNGTWQLFLTTPIHLTPGSCDPH